jgi:hypothetical protein
MEVTKQSPSTFSDSNHACRQERCAFDQNPAQNMHFTILTNRIFAIATTMVLAACLVQSAPAQRPTSSGPSFGGNAPANKTIGPGIAWYGVLQDGLDEAKKTGRPILFVTAAPQCSGVPGMW